MLRSVVGEIIFKVKAIAMYTIRPLPILRGRGRDWPKYKTIPMPELAKIIFPKVKRLGLKWV